MYKIVMFTGGVYKFNELKELVEDVGGIILQEMVMQTETMLHLAFPEEEERAIRKKVKGMGGKLKELPLAGVEIMVVAPSLGKHHAVNPMCDIAEFLRRNGAITNMMGLARGVGKRISQMTVLEKEIIEECDAAVFVFGNFEECIKEKAKLFETLEVPYIIVGGPPEVDMKHYVGGVGRRTARMRRKGDIERLDAAANTLQEAIDEKRREIDEDPLATSPLFVKEILDLILPPKAGEEFSTITQLDGLRVKVEEGDEDKIGEIEIGKRKLSEICKIKKSNYDGYILKILPEAVTKSVY
ncbi:MAG: methyl-coenzyme M reductase family protein [Halobacteriota archaeon]